MPIGHTNNLKTVHFHFLVGQYAHARRGDSMQIFAVVAELFVIARNEIDTMGSLQSAQRRCGALGVDGGAVIQVSGNEDCIRLLAKNLGHQAAQKTAIAYVSKMNVADQRSGSPAP